MRERVGKDKHSCSFVQSIGIKKVDD
jgi:hypothetical protein